MIYLPIYLPNNRLLLLPDIWLFMPKYNYRVDEFAPFAVPGKDLLAERRRGRRLEPVYLQPLNAPICLRSAAK